MLRTTNGHTAPSVRNLLLRALTLSDLAGLWPRLEPTELPLKRVVLLPNEPVTSVIFVETGTVSMIAMLEDGARIEVGLVGPEGMVGLPLLLGAETSPLEAMVQVEGTGLRLPAAAFRAALSELPSLLPLLLRYVDAFQVQTIQSAVCNNRHEIVQRLARWLLMTHDRVDGDTFPMTQEFMSTMLGVRRPGVTIAMAALQRAGLAEHARGTVTVLNRARLEATACECHAIIRRRYAWLTGDVISPAPADIVTRPVR